MHPLGKLLAQQEMPEVWNGVFIKYTFGGESKLNWCTSVYELKSFVSAQTNKIHVRGVVLFVCFDQIFRQNLIYITTI